MKTSFYFVIWIIIYPLLGLIHSPWIDENAFIVALFIVWILSWVINNSMPDIIRYERIRKVNIIMEEIYTGNLKAFMARISRQVTVRFVTAIYFATTFLFILFTIFGSIADEWFALLIFGFFTFSSITGTHQLNKVLNRLKLNLTREECEEVAKNLYKVDYSSYYSQRQTHTFAEMFPPVPSGYKAFSVFSALMAIACSLLGLWCLINSIITLVISHTSLITSALMYFLYGSLACYFGIKDTIESWSSFRNSSSSLNP